MNVVAFETRQPVKPVDEMPVKKIPVPAGRARLTSIDLLRGLVMVVMALDHTRDFFAAGGFNPRDVTDPALFLTRWITHFCAPTFIFLAGISAFLYGQGRSAGSVSRFLLTRGIWLVLIELTVVRFGWSFSIHFNHFVVQVIFVIGASMIALAGLVHLPRWAIAAAGLVMIFGHNLLDGIKAAQFGAAAPVWNFLHQPGHLQLAPGVDLVVLYPLIPWIGVMAAGYALGPVFTREPAARIRELFVLGATITVGFILLRATNLYGDPAPWAVQDNVVASVLSFINCEKYPPSLLYLAMTLGPALMLLAAIERTQGTGRGLDHDLRACAVFLLHRAYLSAACARGSICVDGGRRFRGADRIHAEAAGLRPWSCRHLCRVAWRCRGALPGVPLVCRHQAPAHRMVVELSVGRGRTTPARFAKAAGTNTMGGKLSLVIPGPASGRNPESRNE